MRELLQRAIAEIEKLPAEEQDVVAARILAELDDEQRWSARFNATSDKAWDRISELARNEIRSGETIPLDDVFPPDSPQS